MNVNLMEEASKFEGKWKFIPEFKNALRLFRIEGCTMIVGPPGCGKTEMVNDIIAETNMKKIDVECALLAQLFEVEHSREDHQRD